MKEQQTESCLSSGTNAKKYLKEIFKVQAAIVDLQVYTQKKKTLKNEEKMKAF